MDQESAINVYTILRNMGINVKSVETDGTFVYASGSSSMLH